MLHDGYETNEMGYRGRSFVEENFMIEKNCEMLQNTLPKVKFKILGDGPYRRCFQHLNNIEYIGWVDRSDTPILLSDVNILLFFRKDLGIGEIEALSMGKIIIAPNIGTIPSVIKHGENGFLVAPDVESFVNMIEKTINLDMYTLERISKNARKTASHAFSWKIVGEKWRSVIEYILESKNK